MQLGECNKLTSFATLQIEPGLARHRTRIQDRACIRCDSSMDYVENERIVSDVHIN